MTALRITRGGDWSRLCTFQNGDESPINLTGYAVSASIIWAGGQVAPAIEPVDLTVGELRLVLTETQTGLVPLGRLSELVITWTSSGGKTDIDRVAVEGV